MKPKLSTLSSRVALANTSRVAVPRKQLSSEHVRPRGRINQRNRERVLKRDDYICVNCKAAGMTAVAEEVDHIVPLAAGGSDTDENKQSLCRLCHAEKTARERAEGLY